MGGSNSKQELRDGFRGLLEKNYTMDDHVVWRRLFTVSLMYMDFPVIVSADSVRFLRRCRPQNLAILIYKCVEQLEIFAAERGKVDAQPAKNALGVLARVLPFAFEEADPNLLHPPTEHAAEANADSTPMGADAGREANNDEDEEGGTKKNMTVDGPPRQSKADSSPAAAAAESAPRAAQAVHVDPMDEDTVKPYQPLPACAAQKEPPLSRFYTDFVRWVFFENCMCVEDDPSAKFPIKERLVVLLISALTSAGFIPGFTVSGNQTGGLESTPGHPLIDSGLLWTGGIATHPVAPLSWSEAININRRGVILALVSTLSGELYRRDPLAIDQFHRTLTDIRACSLAPTLVCSMINFVINYEPRGLLPYTSHFITGAEDLALRCAQLLCLMGDTACFYSTETEPVADEFPEGEYRIGNESPARGRGGSADPPTTDDSTAVQTPTVGGDVPPVSVGPSAEEGVVTTDPKTIEPPPRVTDDEQRRLSRMSGPRTPHTHPFWIFFSNLSETECANVLRGLIRLAGNPTYAKSTYLPGSQRTVEYCDEYFILIWKLIDRCGNFVRTLCARPELLHMLLVPLLDYGLAAREEDGRFSPLQLTMFILMRLSAIPEFTISCNEPCNAYIPFTLPTFAGSYADLVVLSMHSILCVKNRWVQHVHLSAAMIINNMSSYVTKLSQTTSAKLLSMLEFTSTNLYLQAAPERPQIFYYVLEAIANLVQYQFTAAVHVVYGLVRQAAVVKNIFKGLEEGTLEVPEAIARRLHVGTLCCAVDAAEPLITAALARDSHADVVEKLSKCTLVGKLPVPHRIITHHFESRRATDGWLSSWLWSCVFIHSYQRFADGTKVALFGLRQ